MGMTLKRERLTQEAVDRINKFPLTRRHLAYQVLHSGAMGGLIAPKPLWVENKIVLEKETRPNPKPN